MLLNTYQLSEVRFTCPRNRSKTILGNVGTYHALQLYNYLITPWSRVLLKKLISFQLVKKFPTFYGNRRFITAFTSARHVSLSWASSIQPRPPHPTSWRSILILSSHLCLGLPSGLYSIMVQTTKPLSALPYQAVARLYNLTTNNEMLIHRTLSLSFSDKS
jgi:hypothetical protein